MRVNKYVLDANIWVSYIITQTESKLLNQIAEGNITIFICDELIQELRRVLRYPQLAQYQIDVHAAISFIRRVCVSYRLTYPTKRYITGDPDDDYIVALALQTNSGLITSGDKHILSEKKRLEAKYKKLKILTKAEFERKVMR